MAKKRYRKSIIDIILKLPLLLLYPLGVLLADWGYKNPVDVERIYSLKIYHSMSQAVSRLFGVFSFSFAEILIYALIICIPIGLIIAIVIGRRNEHAIYSFFNYIVTVVGLAALMYFLFVAGWSLNYSRMPLASSMGYDMRDSSVEELSQLCEELIDETNDARLGLAEDKDGLAKMPYETDVLFGKVVSYYEEFGVKYTVFAGKYSKPKPVLLSKEMCYTEIVGVFIPFTIEANINIAVMPYSIPATACHEAAHQRGFAREDEANFISYILCRDYGDSYFRYSGSMLALIHSMNALYAEDEDEYFRLRETYCDGLNRDLTAKNEFWKQYEGEVAEKATEVNNNYLISNNQEEGVKSYGRMVDLLLAERR